MSKDVTMTEEAPAMMTGEMEWRTDRIDPSPYQRRTHFDEEKLAGLARSVARKGLISRLVCRRVDAAGERLELVAGERRLRACRLAGMERVPVVVRALSEVEAREIVLLENLQREDLTPTEEALSFADLKELGWTDDRISEELDVPLIRVRRALDLLKVPDDLRQAVEDGKVAVSTGALAGLVYDPKRRQELAEEILHPGTQEVPLNRQQTIDLIRESYLVRVTGKCGFDPKDAGLVPVATDADSGARLYGGACEDCPYRSGNDPLVQDELQTGNHGGKGGVSKGVDPNLCTRPECFRLKLDAVWRRERTKAREKGLATLEGKEAEKVFCGYQGALPYDSRYADVSANPSWEDFRSYEHERKKWSGLIQGVDGIEVTVAQHPRTGKVVRLIDRKAAVKAIKAATREAGGAEATEAEAKEKEAKQAEALRKKLEVETGREAVAMIADRIGGGSVPELQLERLLFALCLEEAGSEGAWWLGKWLEIAVEVKGATGRDYLPGIREHVQAVAGEDAAKWRAFSMAALLAWGVKVNGPTSERLQWVMGELGLSLKAATAKAEAALGSDKRLSGTAAQGSEKEPGEVIGRDGRNRDGYHVVNSRGEYDGAETEVIATHTNPDRVCSISLAQDADGWRWGFDLLQLGEAMLSQDPRKGDACHLVREDALADGLLIAIDWFRDQGADDGWVDALTQRLRGITDDEDPDEAEEETEPTLADLGLVSVAIGQPKPLEVPLPKGADPALVAANAEYEERVAAGTPVTIAGLEAELGLNKGQLSHFRSNAKRLAAKKRGTRNAEGGEG